ncbi:hypothetical protein ACFUNF_11160 [Streptomyces sp. NPDC057291]|uniref:hypothetical protein n=1 Tax=Streptomyces sp. NPDC057291 TaxID=3346087 RepID=UPI003624E7C0
MTVYGLITTVLDPRAASGASLVALYAQRWEIETTLDEIKTRLGGPHLVRCSQHPRGVEQEIFAFLLVHHALRDLMHQAARQANHDPDRVSSPASSTATSPTRVQVGVRRVSPHPRVIAKSK